MLFATPALPDQAMWTGRMEFVTTVTYKQGIKCEYSLYGKKFWKVFVGISSCPQFVEVE